VFRVVDGGRSGAAPDRTAQDGQGKLRQEGERRLKATGYDRFEARERVAGIPVPVALKHFKLQLEFTIGSLSRLEPLPADYMLDGYWPSTDHVS